MEQERAAEHAISYRKERKNKNELCSKKYGTFEDIYTSGGGSFSKSSVWLVACKEETDDIDFPSFPATCKVGAPTLVFRG